MAIRQPKSQPTWIDVKEKLASFDRHEMLGLIQDLYGAHKENQTFLHTRLGLGEDPLKPYKEAIDRWVWPDVMGNEDASVSKAKKAISDYKKAVGNPAGLAELWVFYCERAAGFCEDCGYQDMAYFEGLLRAFEQAAAIAGTLPDRLQKALIGRLHRVGEIAHGFGYGVGEHMDFVLAQLPQAEE
jgi:hypothetical protein